MPEYDISVIVPVYNAEKYLNQCVDSILAQTKKNIEIVLIDDGSTDQCGSIIDDYAREHENIVAVHQKNSGVVAARVEGLRRASGKYIGWVDADDFISPYMYEELYTFLQDKKADYVYCDYEFYPHKVATKEKWFKLYRGRVDWDYIERNNQEWNSLTDRKLIDETHVIDLFPQFGEYAWIAILLHAKRTAVLEKPLYYYRVGINSLSGGTYKGKVPKFRHQVDVTANMHQLIDGTKYEEELRGYFDYRHSYTLLQLCVVAAINSDRNEYSFARRTLKQKHFRRNPLVREILDHNHGKAKSFVLRYIIPSNYLIARALTSLAYK